MQSSVPYSRTFPAPFFRGFGIRPVAADSSGTVRVRGRLRLAGALGRRPAY